MADFGNFRALALACAVILAFAGPLAAAQGNEDGRDNRNLVTKQMTPADISEAQRLAREWVTSRGLV